MNPSSPSTGRRLRELAEQTGATLVGDGDVLVDRVATLAQATAGSIGFLANPRYRAQLASTGASAVIVGAAAADATPLPRLVAANPYATFARIATLLHPPGRAAAGIHPTAVVDPTAQVARSAALGPGVVVGAGAVIGERAQLDAHVVIGAGTRIGDDVTIHANATVYAGCRIGPRTILHAGAVIGADGFGMAEDGGRWIKIPQVGGVTIGADVEVGANSAIDRGAIEDTIVEDDVKIDNLVQVAHNCVIGAHTAIAGCVGIAGSTRIGRNCKIGGAAMISGHLTIADGTVISGSTGVYDSIAEPGVYTSAFPALPHRDWRRVFSEMRRLRDLADRVATLERALAKENP